MLVQLSPAGVRRASWLYPDVADPLVNVLVDVIAGPEAVWSSVGRPEVCKSPVSLQGDCANSKAAGNGRHCVIAPGDSHACRMVNTEQAQRLWASIVAISFEGMGLQDAAGNIRWQQGRPTENKDTSASSDGGLPRTTAKCRR